MKRTLTIGALACFSIAGAAVAGIFLRGQLWTATSSDVAGSSVIEVVRGPIANRDNKKDKLPTTTPLQAAPSDASLNASLRQAFANDSALPNAASGQPSSAIITQPPAAKSKPDAKPSPQKNYALLSDIQIAAIKGRLNLSATQEPLWPPIEDALRSVARKIHETKQAKRSNATPPIDPSSAEVQQLKSAAAPLLVQLREDQKREVRSLARIIGLEQVASQI